MEILRDLKGKAIYTRAPSYPSEVVQMPKPEKRFRCGAVEASIFENEVQQNGKQFKVKKVSFQKRYKASDGWKSTNSLDVNDLPKAILALQKAFEYLTLSQGLTEEKNLEDGNAGE
jgi:hypothetical protein